MNLIKEKTQKGYQEPRKKVNEKKKELKVWGKRIVGAG